ncbi:MAG: hypothetical protein AAF963_02685, partial [Bacteroidota bacterium]
MDYTGRIIKYISHKAFLLVLLLFTGCGPSQKEQELAQKLIDLTKKSKEKQKRAKKEGIEQGKKKVEKKVKELAGKLQAAEKAAEKQKEAGEQAKQQEIDAYKRNLQQAQSEAHALKEAQKKGDPLAIVTVKLQQLETQASRLETEKIQNQGDVKNAEAKVKIEEGQLEDAKRELDAASASRQPYMTQDLLDVENAIKEQFPLVNNAQEAMNNAKEIKSNVPLTSIQKRLVE